MLLLTSLIKKQQFRDTQYISIKIFFNVILMGNMKMGTSVIANFNGHYQTVHSAPLTPTHPQSSPPTLTHPHPLKKCPTHHHPPKIMPHPSPPTQNNAPTTQNNSPFTPTHPYLPKIMPHTLPRTLTHPK